MSIRMAIVLVLILVLPAMSVAQTNDDTASDTLAVSPDEAIERAREAWENGSFAEALDVVRRVLEADSDHVPANVLAGDMLIENNDYELARKHYRAAIDVEPLSFRANLGLGKIWIGNRVWRQAVGFLEKAERVAPTDRRAEVKRLLAVALNGAGKTEDAIEKAREALQIAPDDIDALRTLVQLRQTLVQRDPNQLDLALEEAAQLVELATKAVSEAPWERERLAQLRTCYDIELSILQQQLQSLYEINTRGQPTDELKPGMASRAAGTLSKIAVRMRRMAALQLSLAEHDTVVALERAAQYEPDNVAYLTQLAEAYHRIMDRRQAVAVFQRILELDPDNEEAKSYLSAVGATPATQPAEQ